MILPNLISDNTCMSQSEAKEVMGKFRHGELNILVATSVLGEGIDIPACNGVIRYLFITDAIAEKQIPGTLQSTKLIINPPLVVSI